MGENLEKTQNSASFSGVLYANLVDENSRKFLKNALENAEIPQKNIDAFFASVDQFNNSIEKKLLHGGFQKVSSALPDYDQLAMMDQWDKNHPNFPGKNCRITTYEILENFIQTRDTVSTDSSNLFPDKESIETGKFFTKNQQSDFYRLFSAIPSPKTQDIKILLKTIQDEWKKRGITFSNDKVSMVSVFMQDAIDLNDIKLFIGHVGVLLPIPNEKGYYFIEKINFTLPYQVVRFPDKATLSRYLMKRYDIDYTGDSARPIILENYELIDGYAPNPDNHFSPNF